MSEAIKTGPHAVEVASRGTMQPAGESLADELKLATRDAHTKAERHPVQARMISGRMEKAEYIAYLSQNLVVWQALDTALASARDPRVVGFRRAYHEHAPRILADIAHLNGGKPIDEPLPQTQEFVQLIARVAGGPGLLGVWYVLEGSTNGGRFIAKALGPALGLTGPDGLRTLDPHGEAQRERWSAWRAGLDAQVFTPGERQEIIAAANDTFAAMYDLMEGMVAARV